MRIAVKIILTLLVMTIGGCLLTGLDNVHRIDSTHAEAKVAVTIFYYVAQIAAIIVIWRYKPKVK